MTDRDPLIIEREKTHGRFDQQGAWAQHQKEQLRRTPKWASLQPAQREALEMMETKKSRILFGNHAELDHWKDIAGYANLGAENCV